jgi:hypothetical protein
VYAYNLRRIDFRRKPERFYGGGGRDLAPANRLGVSSKLRGPLPRNAQHDRHVVVVEAGIAQDGKRPLPEFRLVASQGLAMGAIDRLAA